MRATNWASVSGLDGRFIRTLPVLANEVVSTAAGASVPGDTDWVESLATRMP